LALITAHQYIEQLEEEVAAAVFGNVGTIISFRVGASDAEHLAKEFAPVFVEEDIINLAKYEVYLKLMIDGVASSPFSAKTLSPIAKRTDSREKVVKSSRERYALTRVDIETKVNTWAGFDETTGTFTGKPVSEGGAGVSAGEAPRENSDRQYKANCSRCNKELHLKFPPDPNRPFYCKECLPFARAEAASAPKPPAKPAGVSAPTSPRSAPKPIAPVPAPMPTPSKPPRVEAPKPVPKPVEAPKMEKPLPPPPKPGMFGGKIRIVKEADETDVPGTSATSAPTAPVLHKPAPPRLPSLGSKPRI
jgi:CxxC-x17-CxxC domain-containing protein